MIVERLAWDSTFFGLRIGKTELSVPMDCLELVANKDQLRKEFDLIYVFSNFKDANSNNLEAFLVDQKATYVQRLSGIYPHDGHICTYDKKYPNEE